MSSIITFIVFMFAIWYMLKVNKQAINKQTQVGQMSDSLSDGEKVYIWITCFLNPLISGAVFYYGWKTLLPNKAKQANAISMWAFLIEVIFGIIVFFAFPDVGSRFLDTGSFGWFW